MKSKTWIEQVSSLPDCTDLSPQWTQMIQKKMDKRKRKVGRNTYQQLLSPGILREQTKIKDSLHRHDTWQPACITSTIITATINYSRPSILSQHLTKGTLTDRLRAHLAKPRLDWCEAYQVQLSSPSLRTTTGGDSSSSWQGNKGYWPKSNSRVCSSTLLFSSLSK